MADDQSTEQAGPVPATLEELSELAPDRPGFVIEQLKKGSTLNQAVLALTREEREEARTERKSPVPVRGGEALDFDGEGSPDKGPENFVELAKAEAEKRGISYREAMRRLCRKDNEGHRAYVDAIPRVRKKRA